MRNVTEEIGRWMKSKRVDGKRDIPLGSQRWTPLSERVVLGLRSLKPLEAAMAAAEQMCS